MTIERGSDSIPAPAHPSPLEIRPIAGLQELRRLLIEVRTPADAVGEVPAGLDGDDAVRLLLARAEELVHRVSPARPRGASWAARCGLAIRRLLRRISGREARSLGEAAEALLLLTRAMVAEQARSRVALAELRPEPVADERPPAERAASSRLRQEPLSGAP